MMMRCLALYLFVLGFSNALASKHADERKKSEEHEHDEDYGDYGFLGDFRNAGNGGEGSEERSGEVNVRSITTTTTTTVTSTTTMPTTTTTTTTTNSNGPPTTTTLAPVTTTTALKCTFPDHYCNPTADDLIRKVEDIPILSATHCRDLCQATNATCNDYTFFDFRGIKTCFLLKGCSDIRPKCTVATSCVSGKTTCDNMNMCDELDTNNLHNKMKWRCQGGINPYEEKIPAGTPCYTYCPGWILETSNGTRKNFVVKSICNGIGTGSDQWGPARYFPPGTPIKPAPPLNKPTESMPQCACSDLKLPYNPNTNEPKAAMFYCDNKTITWDDINDPAKGGVRISTHDRCHLFCDKMLISITECKDGIWSGRPDLGYWCNDQPTEDITNWDPAHGNSIQIRKSNRPRKSEQQAEMGDYKIHKEHFNNNFYDGGYDENLNNNSI